MGRLTQHILVRVSDEGLKGYNSCMLTEEEKSSPYINFGRFQEQQLKEIYGVNRLKLMFSHNLYCC